MLQTPPQDSHGRTDTDRRDPADLSARLRELRKAKGLTLQQASDRCGVAASTISKIERRDLSPTVSTLQRIATGLGIEVAELLTGTVEPTTAVGRRSVTRGGQGRPHKSETCINDLLCADLSNKKVTPVLTRVVARQTEEYRKWAKSDAEIFLMVMAGTLIVHSRLYEPLQLEIGDSMYYDAGTEYCWTSLGEADAEILWVITS